MRTVFGVLLTAILAVSVTGQEYSQLWGQNGEKWNPSGQLKDFTNCGYKGGSVPIPDWPVKVNVMDKGAVGDGTNDDTKALRDAIAACGANGTVYLPAGRYRITGRINISKSGVCIRGESMETTTLYMPNSLNDIDGGGCTKSNFSYDDGIITVTGLDVGIENLKIEFPDTPYRGHFQECGYNAFNYTNNVRDVWLRNIHIHNADNGLKGDPSSYGTIQNIVFTATRAGRTQNHYKFNIQECVGHHGLNMEDASHWLVRGFDFRCEYIHAIGVESTASWNVFCDGRGDDFDIDHHDPDPMNNSHHNLWTNIDAGVGQRLLYLNNSHGTEMYEAYWGIRADQAQKYPDTKFQNVFVGVSTDQASQTSSSSYWYESIDPAQLYPPNIWQAQMAKKQGVSYGSLSIQTVATAFAITSYDLPAAYPGETYYVTLGTRNADGAVTWTLKSGSLPGGVALLSNGTLSGTVSASGGDFVFTVEASDGSSKVSRELKISVKTPVFASDAFFGTALNWEPTPAAGAWDVVSEGGDARYAIVNKKDSNGDRPGAYSLVKGREYADFTMTFKAKAPSGAGSQDIAAVFGYRDANNFYYVVFNATAEFNQAFKVVDGTRTALATASGALISDTQYHTFKVSRAGATVNVYRDDVLAMTFTDAAFGTGRVGIGSYNDAAWFDEIVVSGEAAVVSHVIFRTVGLVRAPRKVLSAGRALAGPVYDVRGRLISTRVVDRSRHGGVYVVE